MRDKGDLFQVREFCTMNESGSDWIPDGGRM